MDCTGTRSLKITKSIRAQGMSLVINKKRGRRLLTVKSRNSDRKDDQSGCMWSSPERVSKTLPGKAY